MSTYVRRPDPSVAAMRIAQPLVEEIVAHAREDLPNECCGMVGGVGGEARTVYRAENAEASPLRYSIDAREQFRLMKEIEAAGEELAAIYHSHTASPAYPSQTDINLALVEVGGERIQQFPGTIYLIASLAEGEEPLRGFDIGAEDVREVELELG